MSIVYPINAIRRLKRDDIGPVAYSLASISQGFALLPGICLTTEAYRRHVRRAKARERFPRTAVTTPADLDKLAARMVKAILQCPVEDAVVEALEANRHHDRMWLVGASVNNSEPFTQLVPAADRLQAVCAAWASPWAASRVRARLRAPDFPSPLAGGKGRGAWHGWALAPEPVAVLMQLLPREVRATGMIRRATLLRFPPPCGEGKGGGEGWEIAVGRDLPGSMERVSGRFFLTEQGNVVHEQGNPNQLLSSQELSRLGARARRAALSHSAEVHWLLSGRRVYAVEARQTSAVELKGIAASPGTAIGTARLVHTARDVRDLHAGEVVVSAYLIPALTACIPRVAGIVVESGGSTSHLAVVARQFGVPAVLGARGATERIGAGQRLRVDGTLGIVRLVPEA